MTDPVKLTPTTADGLERRWNSVCRDWSGQPMLVRRVLEDAIAEVRRLQKRETDLSAQIIAQSVELAEQGEGLAVAWPAESATNFKDDIYNAVDEPNPLNPNLSGMQQCPLCGRNKPHGHTAQEVIIYRNGVRHGRRPIA